MLDRDNARLARSAADVFRRDPDEGERAFDALLRRAPDDGFIYLQRGHARELAGLRTEALRDFEAAEKLLPLARWKAEARAGIARLQSGSVVKTHERNESVLVPSAEEFSRARTVFYQREPRAVVYDAVLVLLKAAVDDVRQLSPVVGVGALIQSWNFAYYKETSCDADHLKALESALKSVWRIILGFRERDIATFDANEDRQNIQSVFTALERVLGRVGAVKALHVLAPQFFPLWDNPIAEGYGYVLGPPGSNCAIYLRFMAMVQKQAASVRTVIPGRPDVLKAIDEFNYCRFSKRWI